MTLEQVLARVDTILAAQTRRLETDLLNANADPEDVADVLARQHAELTVWRAAMVEVLAELILEQATPPPRERVH